MYSGHLQKDVEFINAQKYEVDASELFSNVKPRYCSNKLHAIITADIALACSMIQNMSSAIAVDCLTGDGYHIQKFLDSGFYQVIGVDLSDRLIDKAREKYKNYPKAKFYCSEIEEFLSKTPEPYDFIFLGSLHHFPDYKGLLNIAMACTKPGGFIYIIEGKQKAFIGKLVKKIDENLYQLLHCPKMWFTKILGKMRLRKNRIAQMWDDASKAEVHAIHGLDDIALAQSLERYGFRFVRHERLLLSSTLPVYILLNLFGCTDAFRFLAQRIEKDFHGACG